MRCAICDIVLPVLSKDDICNVCNWHIKDALGQADPTAPAIEQENVNDLITNNGPSSIKGDQD